MKHWIIYISLVYILWGGISPGYGSGSPPQWIEGTAWEAWETSIGTGWVAKVTDSARHAFSAEGPAIETEEFFKVYPQLDPGNPEAQVIDYGFMAEQYLQWLGDIIDIGQGTLVVDADTALGPVTGTWSVTLRLTVDDIPVEDAFIIFDFEDQRLVRFSAQMLHSVNLQTQSTLTVAEIRQFVEATLPETIVANQWIAQPLWTIVSLQSNAPSGFEDRLVYSQAFMSYGGEGPGFYKVKVDAHTGEILLLSYMPTNEEVAFKSAFKKSLSGSSFLFRHPLTSPSSGQAYGNCWSEHGYHTGEDSPATTGTTVRSAAWGKMALRTYDGAQGNMGNTHMNRYLMNDGSYAFDLVAHLNSHHGLSMRPDGQTFITQNAKIGEVGSTGGNWGPHLHYEIKKSGIISNPSTPPGTITNLCGHPQPWANIWWGYTPMHPDYFGYFNPSSYINSRSVLMPEFSNSNNGWGDFDFMYGTAGSQVYARLQTQNAGTLSSMRVRARLGFTGSSYADFDSSTNVQGSYTYIQHRTFSAGDYTLFPEVRVGSESRTGYEIIFSVLSSTNDVIRDNDMLSTYFRSGGLGTARYDGYGYGADAATGNSQAWAQWYPLQSGLFRVYAYVGGNGSGSARYKIYPSGSSSVQTDLVSFQQTYRWVPLNVNGSNIFDFTTSGYVGLSADSGSPSDVYLFDAIKFEYVGPGGGGIPTLTVNGSATTGNISPAGDVDWYQFTTSTSGTYTIETWAGTLLDNYMYLYGPNSQTTLIEVDDDAGVGNAAKIVRNLAAGTYYVKIRAYDSSSGTGTYTIRVSLPTSTIPSTPGGVTATDGTYTDRVRISWSSVSGATSYQVFRCTSSSTSSCGNGFTDSGSPYDDTGASPGTTYYYRVKACNSAGCSGYSSSDTGYRGSTSCGGSSSLPNQSAATGTWKYYTFSVPSCASRVVIGISGGTGDADLYTKFGSQPSTSSYDCRPYLSGNNETCTHTNPSIGTWYIGVRAYAAFSGVTVSVSYN